MTAMVSAGTTLAAHVSGATRRVRGRSADVVESRTGAWRGEGASVGWCGRRGAGAGRDGEDEQRGQDAQGGTRHRDAPGKGSTTSMCVRAVPTTRADTSRS